MEVVIESDSSWDPSVPPLQPGANLYQSPMTVEVTIELETLLETISGALDTLQVVYTYDATKFKYSGAAYFQSGYGRFTARIWSREGKPNTYAVEVMRGRGDRMLVSKVFEILKERIRNPEYSIVFSPDMFDWEPAQFPEHVMLPPLPYSKSEEGIKSLIDIATSEFDDVAINGTSAIARLCGNAFSLRTMFNSTPLITALFSVLLHDRVSTDTRTLAALSLSLMSNVETVLVEPWGQYVRGLADVLHEQPQELFFQRYCTAILASLVHLVQVSDLESVKNVLIEASTSPYAPLREEGLRGLSKISQAN